MVEPVRTWVSPALPLDGGVPNSDIDRLSSLGAVFIFLFSPDCSVAV